MEELIKTSSPVIALVVLVALHLVVRVGQFLWTFKEKKDAITESGIEELSKAVRACTATIEKLECRIKSVEVMITDVNKIKVDLRRAYVAIRLITGDRWTQIRKIIMEEET